MSLIEEMLKAGSVGSAEIMSESAFFNARDMVQTDLPILNIAFSGDLGGGLVPGLTIIGGESKSFKTLLALYCLKAYFKQYKDSIAILYDSEFSLTPDYLKSVGIDPARCIHVPLEHLEEFKFDVAKRLKALKRGQKVFFLLDSLGQLSSIKEIQDALDEKSVADMTRAKSIRSVLRTIIPHLAKKDIPFIMVNHVYSSMDQYSPAVVGGGMMVTYAANQIFVISKSQEKDASTNEILGWKFTININKSRFVKEKSKLPFTVTYKGGISKYSGLLELAIESGHLIKPKMGWYQRVDMETGEILDKSYRAKDLDKTVWEPIIACKKFNEYVKEKFQLGQIAFDDITEEEILEVLD